MPPKIIQRRSPIHGNGVFAGEAIPAGTTIVEYRGRRLADAEADDIYGDTLESGHTFLFTLNDGPWAKRICLHLLAPDHLELVSSRARMIEYRRRA